MSVPQPEKAGRSQAILTWLLTIAVCAYIAWMGVDFYRSAGVFRAMFASMGISMPVVTLFVIGNYQWFCPLLFGGAVALVIAKQFFIQNKWQNITATFAMAVFVNLASTAMVHALYRPLFDILERLSR
jgi:TRAP-type C4-dicarboxylate transport system permease small subunit